MPETHDVGRAGFFQFFRYPDGDYPDLPYLEHGVEVREIDSPYRIGQGRSFRLPPTRWALVVGRWLDEGGDEEERLTQAMRSRELAVPTDAIKDW